MWIDRRWLGPGIALSVLLNVFLAGIIAGHVIAGHVYVGRVRTGTAALVPAARVRALPADEKARFTAALAAGRATVAAARKAHQAARRALEAEIAAPIFDKARVTAAFADLRQTSDVVQARSNAALIDALAALSPDSRAALVAHAPGE